jgi:hypothetical protein
MGVDELLRRPFCSNHADQFDRPTNSVVMLDNHSGRQRYEDAGDIVEPPARSTGSGA